MNILILSCQSQTSLLTVSNVYSNTEFLVVQYSQRFLQEIKFWGLQFWRNFTNITFTSICWATYICENVSYQYVSTTLLCSMLTPAFSSVCTCSEPEALDFDEASKREVSLWQGWFGTKTPAEHSKTILTAKNHIHTGKQPCRPIKTVHQFSPLLKLSGPESPTCMSDEQVVPGICKLKICFLLQVAE